MIAYAITSFLGGAVVGSLLGILALTRWYVWRLSNPEVVRDILKSFYRSAHPNWLQVSQDDTTRVCPCCGWSEKEGLAAGAERCPGRKADTDPSRS